MASWQFRCVCCGELRDAPMTRPEGNVYLRCIVSREWAWYEPEAFVLAAPGAASLQNGGTRARATAAADRGRARGGARAARASAGRRATGRRRAAGSMRSGRRTAAPSKSARRARKRR